MSKSQFAQDLRRVLNGLIKVANSSISSQQTKCETVVRNSSVVKAAAEAPEVLRKAAPSDLYDVVQRASMVPRGVQQFLQVAPQYLRKGEADSSNTEPANVYQDFFDEEVLTIREEDLEGIYLKSLGVEVLQQNEDGERFSNEEDLESTGSGVNKSTGERQLDSSVAAEIANSIKASYTPNSSGQASRDSSNHSFETSNTENLQKPLPPLERSQSSKQHYSSLKPLSTKKPTSQLSSTSKQRRVPASRVSRLVTFGGLAVGLGIGTMTEVTKRSLGLSETKKGKSLLDTSAIFTEANAQRIVDTLCRVRGAALKIGQILSIQDNTMINPELQKIFERVRHAADFMPLSQMEKMMTKEMGQNWRDELLEFDEKPFAAASIGQVHLGKLLDGRPVAIKIQYPGVAQGINSDIDNLMSVLKVWNVIPEGIFIDKIVEVAKRELAWEVDYIREAACAKRFIKLLHDHPDYYVPEVIDKLSTKQVYTTELIEGIPVDKCESLDQESRDRISHLMLELFFRELFEFQFMQTDPNWSNFLYNTETKQIGLLDFGASREYRNGFVDNYMRILEGAAVHDRERVLQASKDIGFLTGYESKSPFRSSSYLYNAFFNMNGDYNSDFDDQPSKTARPFPTLAMENAHLETVMILGEALRIGDEKYDFGSQNLTAKIQGLVPVMVKERLCPPPEEIYSLHRKLSGVFLLCAKLKGKVQCKPIFDRLHSQYVFGRPDN